MTDTRLATTKIRIKKWAEIINDRINSGLKVNEYCQTHGISRDAYYYWLRKVRAAAIELSEVEFVELKEPDVQHPLPQPVAYERGFIPQASITIGEMNISVNNNTPKELIKDLIEVAANVK